MPQVYVRKADAPARATWTEEQLKQAIAKLKNNEMGLNAVSKQYGVSKKTLLRRYRSGDLMKHGLGPPPMLGFEHERRLVAHIKQLAVAGFAPDRALVKFIAFQFAEKLNIQHRFSQEKKMAGYDWLRSFLQRNPDLSIRKGEGLSVARGQGLNRQSVALFYEVLHNELVKNNLEKMPQCIDNMDESGIQLINKPGSVIAGKGSKDVHVVTSKERGESVTVVACNNAEGHFLPPVLIIKGKNKKTAFEQDLPPGSKVYMNQKSSYINSEIFML